MLVSRDETGEEIACLRSEALYYLYTTLEFIDLERLG